MTETITMLAQRPLMPKVLRTAFAILAVLLAEVPVALAAAPTAATPAAEDIWQKTVAAYAGLRSYSDTGAVLVEAPGVNEKHTFTTRYEAPRSLYFDFIKHDDADRYVIWSDAEAFHTWWQTTGVEDEYPKGTGVNAFGQADHLTTGSALKLLPLIFAQSGLQGPLTNFKDPVLDGTEKLGGRDCHRLIGMTSDVYTATGREVNIRRLTIWIERDTFLIRKVLEGAPKGTPPALAGQTITSFEPQANPRLDATAFQFEAPAAN